MNEQIGEAIFTKVQEIIQSDDPRKVLAGMVKRVSDDRAELEIFRGWDGVDIGWDFIVYVDSETGLFAIETPDYIEKANFQTYEGAIQEMVDTAESHLTIWWDAQMDELRRFLAQ